MDRMDAVSNTVSPLGKEGNVPASPKALSGATASTDELTPERVASMPIEEVEKGLRQMGLDPRAPAPPKSACLAIAEKARRTAKNAVKTEEFSEKEGRPTEDAIEAEEFSEAITRRHTEQTRKILARCDNISDRLSPAQKNAAYLLTLAAQFIDADASYLPIVEAAIVGFEQVTERSLSKVDSAYVETAKGFVDLYYERYCRAIAHFRYAMNIADRVGNNDLRVISRYNLARSFWKKGYYYTALNYACKAKVLHKKLYGEFGRPEAVAAIEIVEGWLLFLLGKFKAAQRILDHAESVLSREGDHIDHGNILSFRGRFAKQEEKYNEALDYFKESISQYKKQNRKHRNVARSHTNIASVYRYMANDLERSLDADEQQVERLRHLALRHLKTAEYILKREPERHHRGLGKVYIYRALIYCDRLEIMQSESGVTCVPCVAEGDDIMVGIQCRFEISEALALAQELGEANDDDILISKAKRIQCSIAQDVSEALALAQEAVFYADRTDSRRERAKAYICRGRKLLKSNEIREAQRWGDKAGSLLTPAELAQSAWRLPLDMLRGTSEQLC